jgi:hypothetical protein
MAWLTHGVYCFPGGGGGGKLFFACATVIMVPVKPFTITTITAHQRAAAQPGWEEGGTPNNFFLCLTVFPWYDLTYLR